MTNNIKGGVGHIEAALAYVKDFRVAVDGGAHEGTITEMLRARFTLVHAFEPGTPLDILRGRCAGWNNVVLHEAALGNCRAQVWFGHDGKKIRTRSWFADPKRPGSVQMMMLDELNLPSLGLMKLDIEGGELNALRGAARTISKHRPVLVTETAKVTFKRANDPGGAGMFSFIRSLGYREACRLPRDTIFIPVGA